MQHAAQLPPAVPACALRAAQSGEGWIVIKVTGIVVWLAQCGSCVPLHMWLQCGKGRVVKVTGIANKGRTATVLLRGSNKLVSGQPQAL